jgi:hypothetical protein
MRLSHALSVVLVAAVVVAAAAVVVQAAAVDSAAVVAAAAAVVVTVAAAAAGITPVAHVASVATARAATATANGDPRRGHSCLNHGRSVSHPRFTASV